MKFESKRISKDLIVVGAGMPGICAAIQAARLGLKVALINDRGYLGGNSSAEIRVSVDGADGCQDLNLYARESGIIEEIRLENLHRNIQGNSYIWDTVLMDFVGREENIELFLNTNIDCCVVDNTNKIEYVSGSQLGSETRFDFYGQNFLDDTGNGTVGYLVGAEFKMGRESGSEYGERIAPKAGDDYVIPSTLAFFAKDTGKPVRYIAPDFAIDLTKADVLSFRQIPKKEFYSFKWYYELGGQLHQTRDSEKIIQMHRELVYGIWDYIKNSGEYPSENYDLEYVACIPGKRESRRLVGDYILREQDITEQRDFEDCVGHGGWSIDLHAIEGFFSKEIINKHYFLKGIYQIPYRAGYSKNIINLFMAGRCMSTTHVAFGSTRVMATLSTLGQALGAAAFLCKKYGVTPRGVYEKHIKELQQLLLKLDQYIVGCRSEDIYDKARKAEITASSARKCEIVENHYSMVLNNNIGMIVPIKNKVDYVSILVKVNENTELDYSVYLPGKKESYNPQHKLMDGSVELSTSEDFCWVKLPINVEVDEHHIFIEFNANKKVEFAMANLKFPGIVCMEKAKNYGETIVDIDTLEMKEYLWRKTDGLPCFIMTPEQQIYGPENINNGYTRPYGLPNIWLSEDKIENEYVIISLKEKALISEVIIYFDSDFNQRIDHWRRSYDVIPEIVKDYDVYYKKDNDYIKLQEIRGNYQRVNRIGFKQIETDEIKLIFKAANGASRVGIYEIRVY